MSIKYKITGMSCATCSAAVEKAVKKVSGVENCTVNLLTNSMEVSGTASSDSVISAVISAGYGASLFDEKTNNTNNGDNSDSASHNIFLKRLISSSIILLVLMYVSMGHVMWGFPLPSALAENPMAIALIELLLTVAVMIINNKFFTNGTKSLLRGSPNMDTLVSMGSFAAFSYSTYLLFEMSSKLIAGELEAAFHLLHNMYFESAAMILTLITVGKMLEHISKGKATSAIEGLINLAPKTAILLIDDKEVTVLAKDVKVGDVFIIKPGQTFAVDGEIISGSAVVDESSLTGESVPVEKGVGDKVYSATVNHTGYAVCKATGVGEQTVLSQIIEMVNNATASKAPIAKAADKISGVFVPIVIAIAVIAFILWVILDKPLGFAIARGISVLVISCPCALGLATPVAIMVGSTVGAKNGILYKTAQILEVTGRAKTVILDKTGTITKGSPEVTDIFPSKSVDADYLLKIAASLEKHSEHPISKAIIQRADAEKIELLSCENFAAIPGKGLTAEINGQLVFGGNRDYISEAVGQLSGDLLEAADRLASQGKTPVYFALDRIVLGIIAVADAVKDDSALAIETIKSLGIDVVMLTGDNKMTADAVGGLVGVNEVIAEVLPSGKEEAVRKFKKNGKVIMVGDGINDAPALTQADCGIAIGTGTDIAIDAADVVLMNSKLTDVATAIRLSRATLRNIHQNLFWAFVYNSVCIPIAAGVLIPLGIELSPMLGAAAMSLSSFCVVSNSLRLFRFKGRNNKKQVNIMELVLKVEGMMCPHCEARVMQCVESLAPGMIAIADHKTATVKVTYDGAIDEKAVKDAITAQGYKVIE